MNWSDVKMYDLSIPIGISTPPWPTYEPLQVKYFKRLAPNGANGQLITHSNHVGTHLDGPRHFDTSGRDIAALELDKLVAPGVVVDLRDQRILASILRRILRSAQTCGKAIFSSSTQAIISMDGISLRQMSAVICCVIRGRHWISSHGSEKRN